MNSSNHSTRPSSSGRPVAVVAIVAVISAIFVMVGGPVFASDGSKPYKTFYWQLPKPWHQGQPASYPQPPVSGVPACTPTGTVSFQWDNYWYYGKYKAQVNQLHSHKLHQGQDVKFLIPGSWGHAYGIVTPPKCKPEQPTSSASAKACVLPGGTSGVVDYAVVNTADGTLKSASYKVVLTNSANKVVGTASLNNVANGATGSGSFSGLMAGKYTGTVKGSDGTSTSFTVTVQQCSYKGKVAMTHSGPTCKMPTGHVSFHNGLNVPGVLTIEFSKTSVQAYQVNAGKTLNLSYNFKKGDNGLHFKVTFVAAGGKVYHLKGFTLSRPTNCSTHSSSSPSSSIPVAGGYGGSGTAPWQNSNKLADAGLVSVLVAGAGFFALRRRRAQSFQA